MRRLKPYLVTARQGALDRIYTDYDLRRVRNRARADYGDTVVAIRRMGPSECEWVPHLGQYVWPEPGTSKAR